MRVWLYAIIRNEAPIMPYFLRHYSTFVNRMIFYDDHSNDGTREIVKGYDNTEIRDWTGTHGIEDNEFTAFANEQWKEARGHADYVIWVDADEFLYHPNMTPLLEQYLADGIEVPQVMGFTMVSKKFPSTSGQIYDEIKTGVRDGVWDKKCIFRGNICYNVGRHSINFDVFNPKSSINCDLKLLHYRCLGMDYLKRRHARNWDRVPEHCRRLNLGTNTSPEWNDHHGVSWFEELSNKELTDVI